MTVEARYLNLFVSPSKGMNLDFPVTETIFPSCNTQIGDDSILTVNNVNVPMLRKRPRNGDLMSVTNSNAGKATVRSGPVAAVNNVPISRKRPRNGDLISVTSSNAGKATVRSGPVTGDNVSLVGDLTASTMQQRNETDRLIFLHMEKVRNEIEEKTKIQWNTTLRAIQEAIFSRLRQKDDEIGNLVKLNATLQDNVRSLYLENQLWKELAQSNEVTINALQSNYEQLLMQKMQINNKSDIVDGYGDVSDTESCCGSNDFDADDDSDEVDEGQILRWRKVARTNSRTTVIKSKRKCRKCGEMDSTVLVLPCRHLCLCTMCGPTVDICPVCDSNKNASVLVSFS